jgi:thiamine-monophosphate kinase
MNTTGSETEIGELGEFGLIDALTANLSIINDSTIEGVGDDAAVIQYPAGTMVVSTDMFIEGVHFDFMYCPLQHLGYKCITASISDIYAMNAQPEQVIVSLALSSKFTVETIKEIYSGMETACGNYGLDLVGGDTTTSKSGLVINVTAIGTAFKEDIVYRHGAQVNDVLVVTGDLGGAYLGYQVLEREKRVYLSNPELQPELTGHDYILRRQLRPEARKDIIPIFKELGIHPTAMIDISDGLSSEALHICKKSKVGCVIYEAKIPIDPSTYHTALKMGIDPTVCALSGGEDYELLFTIPATEAEKVTNHPDFTIIGYITEPGEGSNLITKSNNRYPLQAQGWKHF